METTETPLKPEENPHVPETPHKREIPEKHEPTPQFFQPDNHPEIVLNADARYFLHTAGRWATFLGILGFIFSGLIALVSPFAKTRFTAFSESSDTVANSGTPHVIMVFIYLLIAVFYFFASLYLYQFGKKIKDGTTYLNELQVTEALGKLKSLFKFWGISAIVIIALYILIIIGVIVALVAFKGSIPTDSNAYSFIY